MSKMGLVSVQGRMFHFTSGTKNFTRFKHIKIMQYFEIFNEKILLVPNKQKESQKEFDKFSQLHYVRAG